MRRKKSKVVFSKSDDDVCSSFNAHLYIHIYIHILIKRDSIWKMQVDVRMYKIIGKN